MKNNKTCKYCNTSNNSRHKDSCEIILQESLRVALKMGFIKIVRYEKEEEKTLIQPTEDGIKYLLDYEGAIKNGETINYNQPYRCIYKLLKNGVNCPCCEEENIEEN